MLPQRQDVGYVPPNFWREALSWQGAVSLRVLPTVLAFGALATLVWMLYQRHPGISIEVGPYEIAGAVLGLLLVFRTNAGYERWWEARRLWGGMVNQSRNLVLACLSYGPADPRWREQVVRWTAAFLHTSRARLRGDREVPELTNLLGVAEAARVTGAEHMPTYVSLRIGGLLREGCEQLGMDRFAFLQADRERAQLIDHLGGCERILSTPLAPAYSITIRRLLFLFLATLPFALLHRFEAEWLVPVVTLLVAYAILSLDEISVEMQRPFLPSSLGHLPLEGICRSVERNLMALLWQARGPFDPDRQPRDTDGTGRPVIGAPS
jgi:putative membrane protein